MKTILFMILCGYNIAHAGRLIDDYVGPVSIGEIVDANTAKVTGTVAIWSNTEIEASKKFSPNVLDRPNKLGFHVWSKSFPQLKKVDIEHTTLFNVKVTFEEGLKKYERKMTYLPTYFFEPVIENLDTICGGNQNPTIEYAYQPDNDRLIHIVLELKDWQQQRMVLSNVLAKRQQYEAQMKLLEQMRQEVNDVKMDGEDEI